jgi:AcrR family transcriptional regulator
MSSSPSSSGDLRGRRRRQTERDIRLATLRLAREHGFENVTVEMISEAAGVSPRTFFNYFPSKELAAVPPPPAISDDALARFVAAGPAEPREVLRQLAALALEDLAAREEDFGELGPAYALVERDPKLFVPLLGRFELFRRTLADAVAVRLGADCEEEMADLISAIAIAAVRVGVERWSRSATAVARDGSPLPHVERAIGTLNVLLNLEGR